MAENKKQHYVPQFYMKFFSNDKIKINMFNLKREIKITDISLKRQCYKDYYYGEDLVLERNLSTWEGLWNKILSDISSKDNPPNINTPEYFMFIFFILIQNSRTKYSVDSLIELIESISKEIFDSKNVKKEEFIKQELGIDNVPEYYMSIAVDSYPFLLDLKCKILKNHTSTEFIISDNPIVFYNQLMSFRKTINNVGTSNKGLQIFFPISPDTSILLYDKDVYKVGSNNKNIIEIRNVRDIYQINTLQVCSAYENIYFKNSQLDTKALFKKSKPFLRAVKSNTKVFPKSNGKKKEKLIMMGIEEVRTNLKLSFLTIKKSHRDWLKEFKKLKQQPIVIFRNEDLKKYYDKFEEQVKIGKYKKQDFIKFCKDIKFSFNSEYSI